ncbi:MAG: response regulator transcription factor [Chitinophagaceae bacterium]
MDHLKILIVEDEPLIAEDIAAVLERNGFAVSAIVYTKKDALVELANNLPDMALLDINLNGGLEGIEIATTINKHHNIPFIFITSYSDKITLDLAKHTHPSGYLVKPFNEAGLYSAIEIALFNHAEKSKQKSPELSLDKINRQLSCTISKREFALLQLLYDGQSNKQITDALCIAANTVKKHIYHAYIKLGASSRSTAIARLRQLDMQ